MSNVVIIQDGFNAEDPLSTLKVVTKPISKPAPGQVVVHIKQRPQQPHRFHHPKLRLGGIAQGGTSGSEGVGVVHAVGEGVTKFHKGQRVIPFTAHWSLSGGGSDQTHVCLDEGFVWAVPDGMSDDVAAQFVINHWASYSLLKDLQVPRGEYMIQSAAGSSLGKQVIALARHWGIKTINVVRRVEQKAELKTLGYLRQILTAAHVSRQSMEVMLHEFFYKKLQELATLHVNISSLPCIANQSKLLWNL